jgi:hypothetical protein
MRAASRVAAAVDLYNGEMKSQAVIEQLAIHQ